MKIKEILKRTPRITVLCAILFTILMPMILAMLIIGYYKEALFTFIFEIIVAIIGIVGFFKRNLDIISDWKRAKVENQEKPEKPATHLFEYGEIHIDEKKYIRSYNYPDVEVAGANHYDLTGIEVNMRVALKPEPENQHDDKAVAVYVGNRKIGFLPKNKLQDMYHDYRFKDGVITAVISAVATDKVAIELNYYKKKDMIAELKRNHETKTFKLTGNGKEEMQDAISYSSVGDEVTYTYDFDKDKYMASAVDDIGYFPKSANKYLENGAEAYIYDIDTDDNDKYYIEVIVNCD